MLECNRLCIDPGDGSPALEYRVQDDHVECRIITATAESLLIEKPWKALTPDELSSHVRSGTVVSKWLQRRIGYQRLLRACNQEFSSARETPERSHLRAA